VRDYEVPQNRNHERVGTAFVQKFVNPELKTAVQSELRAEDFVLAEDQEKQANTDAKEREGAGILGFRGERHGWMIVKAGSVEKKRFNAEGTQPEDI
jgi:hypothetical protein